MRCWLLFTLLLATAGCAPRARLMVLRPAEVNITGISRLAVIDFTGQGQTGAAARAAVVSRLAEKQHYALVDQAELSRVVPAAFTGEPTDEAALVQGARQAGADAILTGQVVSYDAGSIPPADEASGLAGILGPSTLTARPPTVALAVKLIDVRTGLVRDARQITRAFRGRDLPDREVVLGNLLSGCADEVASLITPHYEPLDVELARQFWGNGLSALRRGNALARDGKWDEAAAAWQEALANNPQNHAALHNLALADFARGNNAAATSLLDRALAIYADADYHSTRRLLVAQQRASQTALAQTAARPPIPSQ
jgi:tetratricopeptide (TPR) repeat protein